jgi:hypothetical protein
MATVGPILEAVGAQLPKRKEKHNGENKKNLYDLVLTLFLI